MSRIKIIQEALISVADSLSIDHFHVCEGCGYLWCHEIDSIDLSFKESHICPDCGCGPYILAFPITIALTHSNRIRDMWANAEDE